MTAAQSVAENTHRERRLKVYREVLPVMQEAFPKAFPKAGTRPPLCIGAFAAIAKEMPEISRNKLRVFLGVWTRSSAYLRGLATFSHRIMPDGTRSESVSSEHKEMAISLLKHRGHPVNLAGRRLAPHKKRSPRHNKS